MIAPVLRDEVEQRLQAFVDRKVSQLGYDAVALTDRRRPPTGRLMYEERELMENQRRLLVSGTRDLRRNFAIAAWAIRKHLDFVSSFNFQCRTPDKAFNRNVETLVEEWSRPENFDTAGRHGRHRFVRLVEACRCVDGDVFLLKIADGTCQAIEGDRVRNPLGAMDLVPDPGLMGVNLKGLIQGVQIDDRGRSLAYVVNKRTVWGGFEPEALVAAENVIQHGFFDRFDQIRGISPIAAAVNSFQDIYENFDYALAKSKVAQLFGLVFYRDAVDSVGVPSPIMDPMDGDGNEGSVRGQEQYKVDFGRGPFSLDLDPGDKAEFLENKTPSTEFKEFTQAMIAVSLKSLDIPFSFYDEAYTNFFGSRSALQLYLKSARSKQNDLRHVLRMLTEWKLTQWVARGRLQLPAGSTVLQVPFNWVADGVPWWNPQVEITAELSAIAGGLQDFAEVRKEHFGDDWFDMIDRRAEQFAYARAKGFPISIPIALGPVEEEQPAEAVSNAR